MIVSHRTRCERAGLLYNLATKWAIRKEDRMRAFGVDISSHQDHFNFRGNLDFVIMRASVGTLADKRFERYMPEAMRVPVRGAYHYLTSARPWQDQLALFLSILK
jgi:GH25 family lysozyme M1 (1,4-beta-N-acetylmuramidase)